MGESSGLPEELEAALSSSREARENWDEASTETQLLYIRHVASAPTRRKREERAVDTALAAKLGTLQEHARGRPISWWDVALGYLPF